MQFLFFTESNSHNHYFYEVPKIYLLVPLNFTFSVFFLHEGLFCIKTLHYHVSSCSLNTLTESQLTCGQKYLRAPTQPTHGLTILYLDIFLKKKKIWNQALILTGPPSATVFILLLSGITLPVTNHSGGHFTTGDSRFFFPMVLISHVRQTTSLLIMFTEIIFSEFKIILFLRVLVH